MQNIRQTAVNEVDVVEVNLNWCKSGWWISPIHQNTFFTPEVLNFVTNLNFLNVGKCLHKTFSVF